MRGAKIEKEMRTRELIALSIDCLSDHLSQGLFNSF